MKESAFISSLLTYIAKVDMDRAMEAMGGSETLYEKTLTHMARQIPANVKEMDESLHEKNDLDAFAVKVHGIKSVLRHVGKMALANGAEALENAAKAGDRAFCEEHYGPLREELLRFFDEVNEVTRQTEGLRADAGLVVKHEEGICCFVNLLKQAGEAAELCDSMTAYEILFPLTKIHFDESTNALILKAANTLDQFKPYEALEYVNELLSKCENPQ